MAITFYLPTKLIFGSGSVAQLGAEAKKLGKRAMLVTGLQSARKTGLLAKVTRDLEDNGLEVVVFDKVMPNPRASVVDEGADIVRRKDANLIIGLGGGSAMDAAKAIRLASAGDRPIWDYYIGAADTKAVEQVRPLVLVPTIAATGSEFDAFSVITNWENHEKRAVRTPHYFPNVSIVDPELTVTLPLKLTAAGGVDIFLHVAENYITTSGPSLLTDGIMEGIMRVVVQTLPQALAKLDDVEARTKLSWASTVACSDVITLGGSIGYRTLHLIEHALSGQYDVVHGEGLAALLPAWMRYTLPVRKERFSSLGRNVFSEEDGVAAVEKWLDKVGMRLNLRTLGAVPEDFEDIADNALRTSRGLLGKHPNPLDASVIVQLLKDSY
jgi:alcohol dehydrogenase YqhD (iron-dependent ADH family)